LTKKATIIISLVEESEEKTNEELEKEIFKELREITSRIPWCKKIEKVTVHARV
jgi:hypothetical protein